LSHPIETTGRPGFVAIRKYPVQTLQIGSDDLHWSHLEATGEEDSGHSLDAGEAQAGAYTAYHLRARPDLVSVVGIFVYEVEFKLFLSNACRVYHTSAIKWNSPEALQLLYAWMWRLYHPEVDSTIKISMTTPHTFTVGDYDQLTVIHAGESIGRRTIVLAQLDGEYDTVIKEQYIEDSCRYLEGPILERIHKDGRFPGVVLLDRWSHVVNNNGTKVSVEHRHEVMRSKMRLVLKAEGTRLMDVKTPRELLMGIYDLLEGEWAISFFGFQN
jgi:hypothetical protein